ncbi:MAG TPA: hypothetical protein VFR89_01565, partial [candidate division Zixibacteria bacterium]|nr:hypothetical protein [candidate division Zixibacteria bacterium]
CRCQPLSGLSWTAVSSFARILSQRRPAGIGKVKNQNVFLQKNANPLQTQTDILEVEWGTVIWLEVYKMNHNKSCRPNTWIGLMGNV